MMKRKSPIFAPKPCADCKEDFVPHAGNQYRCPSCKKLLNRERATEAYYDSTQPKHTCEICKKLFTRPYGRTYRFCSKKCHGLGMKTERLGVGNPAYRNGFYPKDRKNPELRHDDHKFETISKKMKMEMLKEYGYMFCQKCHSNNSLRWECHHLIFRSEAPKHPNLHNQRNLILLCIKCHNWFHAQKDRRDELVQERELYELFNHLPHPHDQ